MSARLTIVIAARNAAMTIARAVRSCDAEADCPLVLIDDHSTDDTVARARQATSRAITVVRPDRHAGVAAARQCGLEHLTTEYAAWLDADDEWMPGRAARLAERLSAGADIASEAIDLHEGASGAYLRRLTVPAFLRGAGGSVRLFERNFLPGDTQVAFRVDTFRRAGGYDARIIGPESYDLLLRAILGGARLSFGDEAGYRMYAYDGSVSRHIDRQRRALVLALRKHAYEDVARLYARAGYGRRITAWALVSIALFRSEPAAALAFLDTASPPDAATGTVLEPDGPWPHTEGWRRAFTLGTARLLDGGSTASAVDALERAESFEPTPEAANNLGVALAQAGRRAEAEAWFATALARLPGFRDAALNAVAERPAHITTHPLRRAPARADYATR